MFQCPAMTKGRQCPDLHMDINSLRVHWSTQHPSNGGADFQPLELSINSVQHIQCPVPGCHFRHLSTNTVRNHWELEHRDHPERFRVIQHTVNMAQQMVSWWSFLSRSYSVSMFQEITGGKRRHSSSDSSQTAAKRKKVDSSIIEANLDISNLPLIETECSGSD